MLALGEARRLAALHRALEASTTWGEFLKAIGNDKATMRDLERICEGELPAADAAFDAEKIPWVAEGHWPLWPKQDMLEWLPKSVQQLGRVESSLMSGDFLHLDPWLVDEVIEALAAEDVEAYEDPGDLVVTACGAWRYV